MGNRIDWTETGKIHSEGHQNKFKSVISRLTWHKMADMKGVKVPMMPGEGIKAAIKEFGIPKVSAISYDCHELAPYGFYGIEGNYKNALVRVFIVDEGSSMVPVCMYVTDLN